MRYNDERHEEPVDACVCARSCSASLMPEVLCGVAGRMTRLTAREKKVRGGRKSKKEGEDMQKIAKALSALL